MGKKRNRCSQGGRKKRQKHWRNEHHMLFPAADWRQSHFGQKLREHRYFRRFIPENTLHKYIHQEVFSIPVPPGRVCERAYREFLRRYDHHLIDANHDTLERRLQLLIDLFSGCPSTVKALKEQQRVAIKFYSKGR